MLSLPEIQQKIKDENLTPKLLEAAMMKQITWADQWMGYDDADTIAMKKAWADGQCFGGVSSILVYKARAGNVRRDDDVVGGL